MAADRKHLPHARTHSHWLAKAERLRMPKGVSTELGQLDVAQERAFECVNPATGTPIGFYRPCDEAEVDHAVSLARNTLTNSDWTRMCPADRKSILLRLADAIDSNAEELALMDSLCMGKPVEYAMENDLPGSVAFMRWYAELIDKCYDELAPSDANSLVTITREPIGVVGLITPWNYPLEEAVMKIAPALAAGNSIVLKPPEIAPLSCMRLGELALDAGLPKGALSVVPGLGPVAGKALALHPGVDCIGFTGSTAVGKLLLTYSGQSNMKPIWLETGGKSATIIFADCRDLDTAAREAARSIFRNKGEVCTAGSRLLVEQSILDRITDAVIAAAGSFEPGDPLHPDTVMGPLASRGQFERVTGYIELGLDEGAELLLDGRRNETDQRGYFIGPTVFGEVANSMRLAQEEIFGPVLSLIAFDTEEQAVAIANDSTFGLAASIWTDDGSRAHRMARSIQAGAITVNGMDQQSVNVPFGGYKQSGLGREHGRHALEQYSAVKSTWYCF